MINVLHVSASYKPAYVYGGPTISVGNLCEQLNKNGVHVTVFTTTANGAEDFMYADDELIYISGVGVRYFKRVTKDHSHFSPELLRSLWKNCRKFDLIHIHAWWNLVSVGAAMICVLKNRKYVFSPRGTLSRYSFNNRTSTLKKVFHQLVGKPVLRRASFLVSSAKEQGDIANLGLDRGDNVHIAANIVELPALLPQGNQFASETLRLIFFSRIEEKKGLEFLIDALNYTTFPIRLDIYGTGNVQYINQIKEKAASNRNSSAICFHGAVYGEEKFDILSRHDILILPSYDENFANVVIESLSVGTLVALTKEVGLSDVVIDENVGWIVKRDGRNIAEMLNRVSGNRNELRNMSMRSVSVIKTIFSADVLAADHIALYKHIINETIPE